MLVIGKGLGGGIFPLAALIARESLDVAPQGALGHFTHEKNPVACAAALATLSVIADTSAPGTLSMRNPTDVRSEPVRGGGGPGRPTKTNRVRAFFSSTTPSASVDRP